MVYLYLTQYNPLNNNVKNIGNVNRRLPIITDDSDTHWQVGKSIMNISQSRLVWMIICAYIALELGRLVCTSLILHLQYGTYYLLTFQYKTLFPLFFSVPSSVPYYEISTMLFLLPTQSYQWGFYQRDPLASSLSQSIICIIFQSLNYIYHHHNSVVIRWYPSSSHLAFSHPIYRCSSSWVLRRTPSSTPFPSLRSLGVPTWLTQHSST